MKSDEIHKRLTKENLTKEEVDDIAEEISEDPDYTGYYGS